MEKKNISFVCPNCGTELSIEARLVENGAAPAASHECATPATGKVTRSAFLSMNAKRRLEALKKAGVDVSGYLVMVDADDNGVLVRRNGNGCIENVSDDDKVFNAIIANTLYDPRLFRRWVLAGMFQAIQTNGGMEQWLKAKTYKYQWRVLLNEFDVLLTIQNKDAENFAIRRAWWTNEVAVACCEAYIDELRKQYYNTYKYGKSRYFAGKSYTDKEFDAVVRGLEDTLDAMRKVNSLRSFVNLLHKFNDARIKVDKNTKMERTFVEAYKGCGVYYAAENLIKFHGCRTVGDGTERHSLKTIRVLSNNNAKRGAGFHQYAWFKDFLTFNNVDIVAKQREWRKAKARK